MVAFGRLVVMGASWSVEGASCSSFVHSASPFLCALFVCEGLISCDPKVSKPLLASQPRFREAADVLAQRLKAVERVAGWGDKSEDAQSEELINP